MKTKQAKSKQPKRTKVRSSRLLARTIRNLTYETLILEVIAKDCEDGGESRIAHECRDAARVIKSTIELARTYKINKPLPTLEQVRGVWSR